MAASYDAGGVVASRGLGPEMSDAEGRVEFVVRFYRDFARGTVKLRVDQPPFTVFQKKWAYADIWGREVEEDVVLERGETVTIRIENVPRDLLELRTIWVHAVVGEGDDIVHAALLHPDPETGTVVVPVPPGKSLQLVATDTSEHFDQVKLTLEAPIEPEIVIRLEPDQEYTPLTFRIPAEFPQVTLKFSVRALLPGDSRTVSVGEWGYGENLANPDGSLELRALPPGGQLGISARGSKSEGDDWTLELPTTPGDAIDFEIDVP